MDSKEGKVLFTEDETFFKRKKRWHLIAGSIFLLVFIISASVLIIDYLSNDEHQYMRECYLIIAVFLICALYMFLSAKRIKKIVIRSKEVLNPIKYGDSWIKLKDIAQVKCQTIPSDKSGSITLTLKHDYDRFHKNKIYLGRFNKEDTYTLLFIFQQNQIPIEKDD